MEITLTTATNTLKRLDTIDIPDSNLHDCEKTSDLNGLKRQFQKHSPSKLTSSVSMNEGPSTNWPRVEKTNGLTAQSSKSSVSGHSEDFGKTKSNKSPATTAFRKLSLMLPGNNRSSISVTSSNASTSPRADETSSLGSQDRSPPPQDRSRSIRKQSSDFIRRLSRRRRRSSLQSFERPAELMPGEIPPMVDTDGSVSCKQLLQLFRCAMCTDALQPPLPQCCKGHLICQRCKSNSANSCPVCKQRFATNTNHAMEQVYGLMNLPCRFGPYGCSVLVKDALRSVHESFCCYRPVPCQYYHNGCHRKMPFPDMEIHLPECHFRHPD